MKIKNEEGLTIISSDIDGLLLLTEISNNEKSVNFIIEENENIEQYSLNANEIDLVIKHLEKSKEILLDKHQ